MALACMLVCAVGARGTAGKRNGHCQAGHSRHTENGHAHVLTLIRDACRRTRRSSPNARSNEAHQLFFTDYGASSLFKKERSH